MEPVYLYEIYFPGDPTRTRKFETWGEVISVANSEYGPGSGYHVRKCRPRNRKHILESLLQDQGLGHLQVWYRPGHPAGWMICEEHDGPGYQRLGYNFAQSVDMIRSGTIKRLFGRPLKEERVL